MLSDWLSILAGIHVTDKAHGGAFGDDVFVRKCDEKALEYSGMKRLHYSNNLHICVYISLAFANQENKAKSSLRIKAHSPIIHLRQLSLGKRYASVASDPKSVPSLPHLLLRLVGPSSYQNSRLIRRIVPPLLSSQGTPPRLLQIHNLAFHFTPPYVPIIVVDESQHFQIITVSDRTIEILVTGISGNAIPEFERHG